VTRHPWVRATYEANPPQPQPISRTWQSAVDPGLLGEPGVLGLLRLLQGDGRIREVRGRVGHRVVEEQRVQLVGEVVVRLDVALRLPETVRPHRVDELVAGDVEHGGGRDAAQRSTVGDDDPDEGDEVVGRPPRFHVRLTDPDGRPVQQIGEEAPVVDVDARPQLAGGVPEGPDPPVRQGHLERADLELAEHPGDGRESAPLAGGRGRTCGDGDGCGHDASSWRVGRCFVDRAGSRGRMVPSGRRRGLRWNGVRSRHNRIAWRWIR
jgi:hypothetical protein